MLSGRNIALAGAASLLVSMAIRAAVPDLPLSQIIERNIAARGGLAAWRTVKTLSMSGTMDAGTVAPDPAKLVEDPRRASDPRKRLHPDPARALTDAQPPKTITLPFEMDLKRPRMMRVDLKVKNETAVQVYDGTRGWKLRPYLGRHEVEPYSAAELQIAAAQQDLDGPLVDYASKGTKIERIGVEAVNGRDAYKLKLILKGGQVCQVWIDAETFLDVKIDTERRVGKKTQHAATLMGDYRTVQGLQIPFLLENRVDNSRAPQKLVIAQVSVNPPLSDTRFAKPE
jgi:hypothetical protein